MTPKMPLIGFDRYIDIEWCRSAFEVAMSKSTIEDLRNQIAIVLPGAESQRKTLDVLRRLSTNPFPHLTDFVGRGIAIYKRLGQESLQALVWGVSLASYPFFGKTIETTGRLLALQGDCSIKELQRRIAEQFGDRSGIERAVTRVLQSQVSWRVIGKDGSGKRINKGTVILINDEELTAWMIEAAIRFSGKTLSVDHLQSMPILFPFTLARSLTYAVSCSVTLELRSDGAGNKIVSLR